MSDPVTSSYDPFRVEAHWQRAWGNQTAYGTARISNREKYYVCDYLPTPNGLLHMGHARVYLMGDVLARQKRQLGFDVLHPMAFDSFGLPVEIEAIKTGRHPLTLAQHYSQRMYDQFRRMGYATHYGETFSVCEPRIYRWTQKLFLHLYRHDLAYRREGIVNYCPRCATTLAHEQVEGGGCWRCESPVEVRTVPQWYYRITRFAEDLLEGLSDLPGWPESMKKMQRNWIGRSDGVYLRFPLDGGAESLAVFTTRAEAIYGTTFLAVAPTHALARRLTPTDDRPKLDALLRRERDHNISGKAKLGWRLPIDATHPLTNERLPVFVVNYVDGEYAEGAVAGVPGHDVRDAEFAETRGVPFRHVTSGRPLESTTRHPVLDSSGMVINSGPFSNLPLGVARERITAEITRRGIGRRSVVYRLHDWCISRQRYWGTPIPIVYCSSCGPQPVPDSELPVHLPLDVSPSPRGNALSECTDFLECGCPSCGRSARRESDTMDTYCDSAWYVFRSCSPDSKTGPVEPRAIEQWMPIDTGVGGVDAINFLLYTRFMCRAMRETGMLDLDEPVRRLLVQYPLLSDGKKMGKRLKNTTSPDTILAEHGADALRLLMIFLGAAGRPIEWKPDHLIGCRRFLDLLWGLCERFVQPGDASVSRARVLACSPSMRSLIADTIEASSSAYERHAFNVALQRTRGLVRRLQEFGESADSNGSRRDTIAAGLIVACRLVAPIAPHICEEIWHRAGGEGLIETAGWPRAEVWRSGEAERRAVLQLDGKRVAAVVAPRKLHKDAMREFLLHEAEGLSIANGSTLRNVVFFRGRRFDVLNIVTKTPSKD